MIFFPIEKVQNLNIIWYYVMEKILLILVPGYTYLYICIYQILTTGNLNQYIPSPSISFIAQIIKINIFRKIFCLDWELQDF